MKNKPQTKIYLLKKQISNFYIEKAIIQCTNSATFWLRMFSMVSSFKGKFKNQTSKSSKQIYSFLRRACVCYFLSIFNFFIYQMIGLQKLWKMFYISSKNIFHHFIFLFLRYSNFCNFFPSFPDFPDSKGQMEVE